MVILTKSRLFDWDGMNNNNFKFKEWLVTAKHNLVSFNIGGQLVAFILVAAA